MPDAVPLPTCLRGFFERMYPQIDLDSLAFQRGVPWYTFPRGAITIGPNIYFREKRFDFCSPSGVALAAHELFHIYQGADGPGFWFLRPFYAKYLVHLLASGFKTDSRHAMEAPAYDLQELVKQHFVRASTASGQPGPCACTNGEPSGVNQSFIDEFFAEWPALSQ